MSKQTDDIRALLDDANDDDVVINYADGTSANIGSHRKLLEDQLALSEFADKMLEDMGCDSWDLTGP